MSYSDIYTQGSRQTAHLFEDTQNRVGQQEQHIPRTRLAADSHPNFRAVPTYISPHSTPSSPEVDRKAPARMAHYTYGEDRQQMNEDADIVPVHPAHHSLTPTPSPTTSRFPDKRPSLPQVSVLNVEPPAGLAGSPVKVIINVLPSAAKPIRSFRVAFGTIDATTRVAFENRASAVEHVELVATAPLLNGHLQSGRVRLLVQAIDAQEGVLASADAGAFDYLDSNTAPLSYSQPSSPITPHNTRKRFGEPLASDRPAPTRPPAVDTHLPSPRSLHTTSPHVSNFSSSPSFSMPGSAVTDRGNFSPAVPSARSPEIQNGHWGAGLRIQPSGDFEAYPEQASPTAASSSALRHPPIPNSTENAYQPTLLRTSQIGAGGSYTAASTTASASTTGSVSTPKQVTSKAVLKIDGDLNDMAVGWSQEEWQARRRLVQFWRHQDGNVINATFRPIHLHDFKPQSIVISCIFRDDKNECFVTSVDSIYLLEALVGTRFTVEEKNRIRRNLEGFKPITVSKNKQDSEPFFKLIMGFPNPKPRNIEKDVKVFPWKILAHALKKIIGKYSAAYMATDSMAFIPARPGETYSEEYSAPPIAATSQPVSRRPSRDENMTDAPRLVPHSPFAPNFTFGGSMQTDSPSPTSAVFPPSITYHPPQSHSHNHHLLSSHQRSYSDGSNISLKQISHANGNRGFQGHTRSRTTLDGSLAVPQHPLVSSLPVSPISLGSIPELPFLRSISSGNIPFEFGNSHDQMTPQGSERRPSSAGALIEELGMRADEQDGQTRHN